MSEEQEVYSDKEMHKPGFDARLVFNRQLERYMYTLGQFMLSNNREGWVSCLWGMYFMVKPFIKKSDAALLKADLVKAGTFLRRSSNRAEMQVLDVRLLSLLRDLTEDIHFMAKHILLPVGDDTEEEFTVEGFLAEARGQ